MSASKILIYDIMSRNPKTIQVGTSIQEATEELAKHRINSLLVLDGKELKGIITAHDIIFRVLGKKLDLNSTLVDGVMSKHIVSIESTKSVEEAILVLNDNEIEQLPIVDDGSLVGFLTLKDILHIEPTLFELYAETRVDAGRQDFEEKSLQSEDGDLDKLIDDDE